MRCIEAKDVGYVTVWGVSANTRSYWRPFGCERLGWQPVQNSEDYAAEILAKPNPLSPVAQRYQGGGLRRDGLHAAGAAPGLTGGGRLRQPPPPAGAAPRH